jgi:hypothetical protein
MKETGGVKTHRQCFLSRPRRSSRVGMVIGVDLVGHDHLTAQLLNLVGTEAWPSPCESLLTARSSSRLGRQTKESPKESKGAGYRHHETHFATEIPIVERMN